MPAAALAVPAIIGGVTSVIGGIQSRNAAKNAAREQSDAAAAGGQKVEDAVKQVNPEITAAGGQAASGIRTAAGDAGASMWSATDRANGLLDPYMKTGSDATVKLNDLMNAGEFDKHLTADNFREMDPGFDFRVAEANKALQGSAAARGSLNSGAAMKEIAKYTSDYSSSEFGKAFDRFETANNNRFTRLSTLAAGGANVAGKAGNNLIDAGKYSGDMEFAGERLGGGYEFEAANTTARNTLHGSEVAADYLTQGANARAQGDINAAQAWNGALQGVSDAASMAFQPKGSLPGAPGSVPINTVKPGSVNGYALKPYGVRPR